MLKDLSILLEKGTSLQVDRFGAIVDRDLQTMAAVLLVYVAQADHGMTITEHGEVMGSLAKQFQLQDEEAHHIVEVAGFLCRDEAKVNEFGEVLADAFNKGQLVMLLAMIWRVIKADKVVSHFELKALERILPMLKLEKEDLMKAVELYEQGKA